MSGEGKELPPSVELDSEDNRSTESGQAPATGAEQSGFEHSSVWVRLFRSLGMRWTKELDFVVLPAAFIVGLFVLGILTLAGQPWAGAVFAPPILIAIAVLNIAWALWTLQEQTGTLGDRGIPFQNRNLQNAWRARTIAWDVLIVAIVGFGLVVVVWAGPGRVIPSGDQLVVEIAVLIVTVAMLATFARYTAMAFSTDVDSLVTRLESISRRESEERTAETERLSVAFRREVDKLIQRVDRQVEATEKGLKEVTSQLEAISKTLATQAKLNEQIAAAQRAAADAQERAAKDAAEREAQRQREAERAAAARKDQIRPVFNIRLRYRGTLFHKLFLDLHNEGGVAEGVRTEVRFHSSVFLPPSIPSIPSGGTHPIEMGDVTQFPLSTIFAVTVGARDIDGNRYSFNADVSYLRTTGFWGQTKGIVIRPPDWIQMAIA